MFIQGDLQAVFDTLYNMGVIDPVLKLDWVKITDEMMQNPQVVNRVFDEVNACRGDMNLLRKKLETMDQQSVYFLAMEVAREFCEFQDRNTLH
ncbi:MAG: cytochrome [Bdellovibrionia bacterium]